MANEQQSSWTLTARWIIPVETPPLEHGTVTVRGDRVVAVEPHGRRSADLDLGDAAVLPGLVNAHTHLDLSGLRGRVAPGGDFTAWLRAVIEARRGLSPADIDAAVRAGIAESLSCGTTLLGDIAAQGLSWGPLAEANVRAVVFYELLGLPRPRARQAWAAARAWLRAHPPTASVRPGLSPHAPYSVRASLFRTAVGLARRQGLPLATHLAETREELELLQSRRGPFVDFLESLGVWDPGGLVSGPGEVLRLCAGAPNVLVAHGNYLGHPADMPAGATVVYCPRTHAAFGHPPHPFREMLRAGVRVALGTDSLASNPDLDVLAEARFLHHRYPDVPGAALLRMATLAGAEALGRQAEAGSLAAGKSADLVVLPLPPESLPDPYRLVLESAGTVRSVLWRGRWVYGGQRPAPAAGGAPGGGPQP